MSSLLDNSLVGLALLISAGYALTRLGPKSVRRGVLAALRRVTARAPAFLGLKHIAGRLASAAGKAEGACGGCDNCGSEPPAARSPESEVKVPVANIGKRASRVH